MLVGLLVAAGQGGSPGLGLSSVLVASFLPAVVAGPFGGAAADRLGPLNAIAVGWLSKIAALGVAVFVLTGVGPIWLVAVLYACAHQVSNPGEMALVRAMPPRHQQRVHGMSVAAQYLGQGVAFVIAAALVLASSRGLLLVSALGAAVAAGAAALALRPLCTPWLALTSGPRMKNWASGSVHLLVCDRDGRLAVCTLLLKSVVGRAILVAFPLYVGENLDAHPRLVAAIILPVMLGIGAGLIHSSRLEGRADIRRMLIVASGGAAIGLVVLAIGDYGVTVIAQGTRVGPVMTMEAAVNTALAVAIPMALLLGYSLTAALVAGRGMLTQLGSLQQQGTIFAFQEALTEALAIGPVLLIGLGVDAAGVRTTLAATGFLAGGLVVVLSHPRSQAPVPRRNG
jgi:hypothetical protein